MLMGADYTRTNVRLPTYPICRMESESSQANSTEYLFMVKSLSFQELSRVVEKSRNTVTTGKNRLGKNLKKTKKQKHTTGGIPRWSPTLVLVARFSAYVWQSGRDAQFSLPYGRMYSCL